MLLQDAQIFDQFAKHSLTALSGEILKRLLIQPGTTSMSIFYAGKKQELRNRYRYNVGEEARTILPHPVAVNA